MVISSVIIGIISILLLTYSFLTAMEKGPILSSRYLFATEEERKQINKTDEYHNATVVFGILGLASLLLGISLIKSWAWLNYIIGILIISAIIYAITASRINIVAILLCLAVIICWLPLPLRINRQIEGILWENGNSELMEKSNISIDGWYYNYLLKNNVFKGDLRVSDIKETYNLLDMEFHKSSQYGGMNGFMIYYDTEANQLKPLGEITIQGAFKSVFIRFDKHLISAPADTRQEAVELSLKLTHPDFKYQ